MWEAGFQVSEGQDREVRKAEVLSGLNIDHSLYDTDVETAFVAAFAIIDGESLAPPYNIVCGGNRWGPSFSMFVRVESGG